MNDPIPPGHGEPEPVDMPVQYIDGPAWRGSPVKPLNGLPHCVSCGYFHHLHQTCISSSFEIRPGEVVAGPDVIDATQKAGYEGTVSHLGYYERYARGSAKLNEDERAKLAAAREALDRDEWPVHQPECFDAPIPGRQWYGGCEPGGDWDSELGRYTGTGPRVNPTTGVCEGCGATACRDCGRENCPDHEGAS